MTTSIFDNFRISVVEITPDWLTINKFSESFFSKSVTIISLVAFFISNFDWMFQFFHLGRIWMLFFGSALFVAGHLIALIKVPPEIKGRTDHEVVLQEMIQLANSRFMRSRLDVLKEGVSRPGKHLMPQLKRDFIIHVISRKEIANIEKNELQGDIYEVARSLFNADITLQTYKYFEYRLCAFALMLLGIILMFFSTVVNITRSFFIFAFC